MRQSPLSYSAIPLPGHQVGSTTISGRDAPPPPLRTARRAGRARPRRSCDCGCAAASLDAEGAETETKDRAFFAAFMGEAA